MIKIKNTFLAMTNTIKINYLYMGVKTNRKVTEFFIVIMGIFLF